MPVSTPSRLDALQPLERLGLAFLLVMALRSAAEIGVPEFQVFYRSAVSLRDGLNPYAPQLPGEMGINLNTPLMTWLWLPLTWVRYELAAILWTALNVAGFGLSLWLIARDGQRWERAGLVMLSGLTGGVALEMGQVVGLVTVPMTLAWIADRRGKPSAGIWVALAVYAKPFLGLFLVYWIWRRQWREVLMAGSVLVVLGLLTVMLFPAETWGWIEATQRMHWQGHVFNASISGLASRAFSAGIAHPAPTFTPWLVSSTWQNAVTVLGSLLVLGLSVKRWKGPDGWTAVGLTALLLSPLGWIYYVPLFSGALAASVSGGALIALLVLWNIPEGLIMLGDYGPLGTVTLGSFLCWTLIGLTLHGAKMRA